MHSKTKIAFSRVSWWLGRKRGRDGRGLRLLLSDFAVRVLIAAADDDGLLSALTTTTLHTANAAGMPLPLFAGPSIPTLLSRRGHIFSLTTETPHSTFTHVASIHSHAVQTERHDSRIEHPFSARQICHSACDPAREHDMSVQLCRRADRLGPRVETYPSLTGIYGERSACACI